MKITFKNVGQGDTILLEWTNENKQQIAIIDCNQHEGTNPIIDHIIKNNYKEIAYLILSHPHLDHFSGFYNLLNYCKENEIQIKYFLHTSEVVPDYLKEAVKSINAQRELLKLFMFLKELEGKTIQEVAFINAYSLGNGLIIPLNEKYKIKVLAPSAKEKHNYIRKTYIIDEEDPHNNAYANWLSTFLKIYSKKEMILLTSDSEKKVFQNLNKSQKEFDKNLVLAQYPHHGAKKNMLKHFWNKLKHDEKSPIVVSVGKNIYRHPSIDVIEYLEKWHYKVYSTNQVGGLNKNNNNISKLLDMYSTEISNKSKSDQYNGDQVFNLN